MNIQRLPKQHPPAVPTADMTLAKRATHNGRGITDLPPELVVKILTNLNASHLLVCKRVNRDWRNMVMAVPAVAQAFYHSSHPPGFLPWSDTTVHSYYRSCRPWLESFSEQGRKAVIRLDKLLHSGQPDFPEQLFFATVNLLDETKYFHGSRTTIDHLCQVNAVRFSPDEQYLVTAFNNGDVLICRLVDGKWQQTQTFHHPNSVSSLWFSPDSRYFIATLDNHTHMAKIWALTDAGWQENTNLLNLHPRCQSHFSADAKSLVTLSADNRAKIYQFVHGQWRLQSTALDRYLLNSAQFHPVDSHLLITIYQEIINIWRCVDGRWQEESRLAHRDSVRWARFSPNGNRLLVICPRPFEERPQTAHIWTRVDGSWQQENTPQLPSRVAHNRFNRYGNHLLLTLTQGGTDLWQCLDHSWQRVILPYPINVSAGRFSADGSKLVTSHDGVAEDTATAIVWEFIDQQWQKQTLIRNFDYYGELCFSASGNHLLTSSDEKTTLHIWGVVAGKWQEKAILPYPERMYTTLLAPHGGHIVVVGWSKGAHIWTLTDQQGER